MTWRVGIVLDAAYWEKQPPVLAVSDLARITQKGDATIWSWLNQGRIISHQVAGSWITYREVFQHQVTESGVEYPLPVELFAQYPEDLTVQHLSELLGKTKQTVWRWLREGRLPGVADREAEPGLAYKNESWVANQKGSWTASKSGLTSLLQKTSNQPSTDKSG